MKDDVKLISARDVSLILDIPISTVYFYAVKGVIPSIKFGRQRRFKKSKILAWLRARETSSVK